MADGRSDEGPGTPSAGMSVLVKRGAAGCTLVPPGGGAPLSQAASPVDKVPSFDTGSWHLGSMLLSLCVGSSHEP